MARLEQVDEDEAGKCLGGGVSKRYEEYRDYLTVKTPIRVAKFLNNAGIIGAAMSVPDREG